MGKYGSFLVITGFLLFYFHAAFNADGQNVFAPAVAERLDLNPGVVLSMNSIAGLIGVLISVISGQLNRRIGPRKVCSLTFLLGGIAYIMAANAPNIAVYTIAMCFSLGGGLSAALFVGFGAPNANWFPKRLGSVMGLVTIGAGMTTMTYIAAFNKLVSIMGVGKAAFIPGMICIVAAVLGYLIHRDTPAERGSILTMSLMRSTGQNTHQKSAWKTPGSGRSPGFCARRRPGFAPSPAGCFCFVRWGS